MIGLAEPTVIVEVEAPINLILPSPKLILFSVEDTSKSVASICNLSVLTSKSPSLNCMYLLAPAFAMKLPSPSAKNPLFSPVLSTTDDTPPIFKLPSVLSPSRIIFCEAKLIDL